MPVASPAGSLVEQLAARVRQLQASLRAPGELLSSGQPDLDRLLPQGGLRRGWLVEWLAAEPGSGAALLALGAAREACRQGGALVVLDRQGAFYAPAAAALGLDLRRLIVVRPAGEADELWALDQALRTPGVGAVLAWPASVAGQAYRRLQLAAEAGGVLGLLLRQADARLQPCWAEVRWGVIPLASPSPPRRQVAPQPLDGVWRRVRVELWRCRAGGGGGSVELEIDERSGWTRQVQQQHATSALPVVSSLAPATAGRAAARA